MLSGELVPPHLRISRSFVAEFQTHETLSGEFPKLHWSQNSIQRLRISHSDLFFFKIYDTTHWISPAFPRLSGRISTKMGFYSVGGPGFCKLEKLLIEICIFHPSGNKIDSLIKTNKQLVKWLIIFKIQLCNFGPSERTENSEYAPLEFEKFV